jgi:hypothetical protein
VQLRHGHPQMLIELQNLCDKPKPVGRSLWLLHIHHHFIVIVVKLPNLNLILLIRSNANFGLTHRFLTREQLS